MRQVIITLFMLISITASSAWGQGEFLRYGESGMGASLLFGGASPGGGSVMGFGAGGSIKGFLDFSVDVNEVSSGRSSYDIVGVQLACYPIKQGRWNMPFSIALAVGRQDSDWRGYTTFSGVLIERIDISPSVSLQPEVGGTYLASDSFASGTGAGIFNFLCYYTTQNTVLFGGFNGTAGTGEGNDGTYGVRFGVIVKFNKSADRKP